LIINKRHIKLSFLSKQSLAIVQPLDLVLIRTGFEPAINLKMSRLRRFCKKN
jgi:hypothetical protein